MESWNSLDHKECPQCREPVRITATKCPHCLSWQGRKFSMNNPGFAMFVPLLIMPIFLFFVFRSINRPAHRFNEYPNQVQVLSANMNYAKEENGNYVSTVGRIQNNSPITWEQVAIEVQYFNAAGELIDTLSEQSYDLILTPNTEQAFRLRGEAARPRSEYVSQKVFVRDATDAHHFR